MGSRDVRVDAYVARAAPFAQPILRHLRSLVHEACPDVEETLKWGSPSFLHHGILCGFAAFKEHAVFGFWKGTLILGEKNRSLEAMGSFGRLTTLADLPSKKQLIRYVKQAMKLNEAGVKAPVKHKKPPKPPVRTPANLATALGKNKKAAATYEGFSPSARREYVEWLAESKRAETRAKRLATAVEWMADGKQRNWKYMKKS
jgi:uncharacterized protein YdeI (YjbR/CyaY-like superfamily)